MTYDEMRLPDTRDAVLVVAFEGWNDAGDAATAAVEHLEDVWSAEVIGELDPEDYYDFQVNRPESVIDEDGVRQVVFPTTRVFETHPTGTDRSIIVMRGIEPNNRWRSFTEELLGIMRELDVRLVVTLGAMLAETPHTRPIPVNATGSSEVVNRRFGLEPSRYEGPTGIIGVLGAACAAADIPVVSLWAAMPHYAAQPPSPKGSLALVSALEEVLDVRIPVADLPEEAHAWETDVDELADGNDELLAYVHQLEAVHDADTPDPSSGESIAQEFERYLRRQGND